MLTWLSSKLRGGLRSTQMSMIFVGSNLGVFIFPPLASLLFNRVGPSQPFRLAFAINLTQAIIFGASNMVVRR